MKSFRILYRDAAALGGEAKWDGENAEVIAPRRLRVWYAMPEILATAGGGARGAESQRQQFHCDRRMRGEQVSACGRQSGDAASSHCLAAVLSDFVLWNDLGRFPDLPVDLPHPSQRS
jgi:hypothetical protein